MRYVSKIKSKVTIPVLPLMMVPCTRKIGFKDSRYLNQVSEFRVRGETRDKPEKIGCVQQLEQLKNLTFVFIIFAIFDDFSEPKQAPHSNM